MLSASMSQQTPRHACSVMATDVELVTVEGIENDRQPADQ
jgi:hypothetical protein